MTHDQQRIFLIRALIEEQPRYRGLEIPGDEQGQRRLLRSLMNLRPPLPASPEFLQVQDAYLSELARARGITDAGALKASKADGRIFLWQGDITTLRCDAIVNAANSALLGCFQPCHSCIDNAIHTFSGVQLRIKCNEIMTAQGCEEPVGTAKITPGYNLPCKYILHTVGPAISGRLRDEDCELLASCYSACLRLAADNGVRSIAFCCISTGVFHFPGDRAAKIAVETVTAFLRGNRSLRQVIFNVFTEEDLNIYSRLLEY